jgi:nucleoredoxin
MEALRAAGNNPDRVAEYLINGIYAPATSPNQTIATTGLMPAPGVWTAEAMLGPELLTKSGMQATSQALDSVEIVALYFSAQWCPPCRGFTPHLAAAVSRAARREFAVVYCSSDRDMPSFTQYYNSMPWLALPFGDMQTQVLGQQFDVRTIPCLVIINAQNGSVISKNGVQDLAESNFDIAACLQRWGFPLAASVTTPTDANTPAPLTTPAGIRCHGNVCRR